MEWTDQTAKREGAMKGDCKVAAPGGALQWAAALRWYGNHYIFYSCLRLFNKR